MKYQNLCLLFSSCDNYEDSWVPFFTLWKKYWPQFENPIYIGTETKQFSSAGLDIRCPLCRIKDDLSSWSKRLIKLLDYVEEDYILFCLDDFWLYKDVNESLFKKCYDYFLQHNDIGFMCLIEQEHGEQYKKHIPEFPMVYESTRNKPFMINTQVGLWRKSYLKKVLKSHESAWFFETRATWRAAHWYKERVFYVNTESNRVFFYPEGGVFGGGSSI